MSKRTQRRKRQHDEMAGVPFWETADGIQTLLPGLPPSPEQLEQLSRSYQEQIRRSPFWPQVVAQYGAEKAESLLQQCRVRTP